MARTRRTTDLDELDYAILAAMSENAAKADVEIARQVGVSNVTIRNRIQRMIELGYITIAAIPDLDAFGYRLKVFILLRVEFSKVAEIVASLKLQPTVRYISLLTGPFDLILYVHFRSDKDLLAFLKYLSGVPGVNAVQTVHTLEVYKIEFGWNPKLRSPSPVEEAQDENPNVPPLKEGADTSFLPKTKRRKAGYVPDRTAGLGYRGRKRSQKVRAKTPGA